jgi:hypothetical protein
MSDKFQISLVCILTTPAEDVDEVFCAWGAKLTAGHTKTSRNLIYTYVTCVYNKHNTQFYTYSSIGETFVVEKKFAQGENPPIENNLPVSTHMSLKVDAG